MCHSDKALSATRAGQKISLYVDQKKLSGSVHNGLDCVGCHADLAEKDLPHEARLAPVNCGNCHEAEQKLFIESRHGKAVTRGDKLAPRCKDCHGAHDILPLSSPNSQVAIMKIPFLCGKCHHEGSPVHITHKIPQDRILENYSEGIHGEGLFKRGLTVTAVCTSCHTAHHVLPHTDPRSSIAYKNIAKTCTRCHTLIEQVHRKVIKGELWEKQPHLIPACVDCHAPHKIRKVFYDQGMADRDCLACHAKKDLVMSRNGAVISLYIDAKELAGSVHSKVACAKCHTEASPAEVRPCKTITKKVDCSICHADNVKQYQTSVHGILHAKNDPNAPTCIECHGKHNVKSRQATDSPTFPINVPNLCARCHREGEKAAVRYTGKERDILNRYTESIHGKGLLKSGLVVTATCTDCHTAHHELPAINPESTVNPNNIAKVCGRCHNGIYELFTQSIHSPQIAKTNKPLPVCSDCHTAHTIRRTDLEGFKLEIITQCGRCHQKIAKTYFDTYHGKVTRLGYVKTAKCYDCHGAHDILPVNDPRSHLSHANVVKTCQKCHPGAHRRFAGYLTHSTHHDPIKYPILFYTFWAMTALLVGTFFVAGLHTFAWLPRSLKMRREHPPVEYNTRERQYVRFKTFYRILHLMVIVSFFGLALTGMTLKFSYTKWAVVFSHILGGFESAGYIHRVCAIITFTYVALHLWDIWRRKKKQNCKWREILFGPNTLLFTKRDFWEFIASIKWFLGLGPRPNYGRWTYWEKFDYFAVFWGVTIIGISGLILWFPELFTRLLPGWFINVATIIHSDEALLAVGFIFTVHFFNTHLRPEKFPMDLVIFTGRVPLDELKRDKPEEYELLMQSGKLEEYLAEPLPPIVIRAIKILASIALCIGISMILLIIYAMIFAYR